MIDISRALVPVTSTLDTPGRDIRSSFKSSPNWVSVSGAKSLPIPIINIG